MPGTKPSQDTASPPCHPHNLAAATTEMMWACALATARTAFASTTRGLAFWSQMLRTPVAPQFWRIAVAPWAEGTSVAVTPSDGSPPAQGVTAAEAPPGDAQAFARYRSSGGHASAQVIVLR